ncbi:MAG: single-stranded-DNA-specific exonuclease RecJ [Lachnospiraceae bacterium]|nr:single-stranded-DNA-specific exonuclease RecJ [Robinsoniella sp.]MDY3766588.1 single-stranded-DNA-specific exonuclease RecJ [Lachnospiraceae bacterium]
MERWFVAAKKADFYKIAEKFHISPVTARLIRNRDIVEEEEIRQYLYGGLNDLHDPGKMKGANEAAALLKEKIRQGRKIRIIGDYDIDGVNASYILLRALQRCGAIVDVEIPDRMKDGYGINEQLIDFAYEEGVDTILTCDNGISAMEQVAHGKQLGMTIVVTDHHELQYVEEEGERRMMLPPADVVVNPKQPGCPYPFKDLCGAAVAWKMVICLYRIMGIPEQEAMEFLEFAAVATVGDVMDLKGENRIIVKEGLRKLQVTENLGLRALIAVNGLAEARITAYHIGFVLGPCINASGRLDTAKRALALLLSTSEKEAMELASELKLLNEERKDMTLKGYEKAVEIIESGEQKNDKVFVVFLPDCHESLAGIIAGRIREKYHRPVFVLTQGKEEVKGSGRSIEAYSMFEEMMKCGELFTKFGGHPMAAGLSIKRENVEILRRTLNEKTTLTQEDLIPKVLIDVPMPIDYITENLVEELELLEPFGKGNTKPLFAEKNLNVLGARILGKNKNVIKMQVENAAGRVMDAMYFGDVEVFRQDLIEKFGKTEVEKLFLQRENSVHLSVTYYPTINVFRECRTLQIVVQNYQ